MAAPSISKELAQQAINAVARHRTKSAAARAIGIPIPTMQHRYEAAVARGLRPSGDVEDPNSAPMLLQQVARLKRDLAIASAESADAKTIKRAIIGLKDAVSQQAPPEWTIRPRGKPSSPGVPTLFLSDLHWGEVVKPSQIMGKNAYNLAIAHGRMQTLVESAIHLLKIVSPDMNYPGIVVPLGGDMVSGNIHEELQASNEIQTMPTVVDLHGVLVKVISKLADEFGSVFLPCVTGNHGRDTHKMWAKDRHHTSFDWLLYMFLAKHFEDDKRVRFFIPDGPDAYYRVYGTRYLLTHGDQFRGGDGMIGALGPIIRGDHKKRSRNMQIDAGYDVMVCGHWHQCMMLTRLIVNGSLKGYDEYAFSGNFPFELPQQALWLDHPKYGITYRMPVYCSKKERVHRTTWAAVAQ